MGYGQGQALSLPLFMLGGMGVGGIGMGGMGMGGFGMGMGGLGMRGMGGMGNMAPQTITEEPCPRGRRGRCVAASIHATTEDRTDTTGS